MPNASDARGRSPLVPLCTPLTLKYQEKYYLFQIHPLVVQLNVTQIAPLATNHAFLDPRKYPNLVRMVPDDSYLIQVR